MPQPQLRRILPTIALALGGMALGSVLTLGLQTWQQQRQVTAPQAASADAPMLSAPLLIAGEPSLGSPRAPLTILEFSDFQCPYCKRFHTEVLPQLKRHYIDRGLVRFVHKDLPLPFHPQAQPAATVARCAMEDGRFWRVYDALFARQTCLECLGPVAVAEATGIDRARLMRCLQRGKAAQVVNANRSEAQLQAIRATPTFVIGPSRGDQHLGRVIEGAMPWPEFQRQIEAERQRLDH